MVGVTFLHRHFPVTAPQMTGTVVIITGFTKALNVDLVKEVALWMMIVRAT